MFMRLVHATSVAFFREKTNATEVACSGNAAQLFAGHNAGGRGVSLTAVTVDRSLIEPIAEALCE
jgi:hypothetical protein